MNSRYKGIFFITLSALSFAFMNAFVRLSGDLPSVQKSFFRNLVAFFIALIMIIRSKDGFKIEKGNLKYMILRATFGTVGILCNFYAVDHLVLSDASMLNKMSPFFVIIFSFLLLNLLFILSFSKSVLSKYSSASSSIILSKSSKSSFCFSL